MEKVYKQCQSCGMPLKSKHGDNSGTEADGSSNAKFCSLCYLDGKFLRPEISLKEMRQIVDTALKQQGWIRPLRWLALTQLPSLERWKSGQVNA